METCVSRFSNGLQWLAEGRRGGGVPGCDDLEASGSAAPRADIRVKWRDTNRKKTQGGPSFPWRRGTRPTCVPRVWHRWSATGCGLASRLWHRPPRAGPQRPQGIPAVTDMLHYGYYFAVWPKGVRQRGWVSGFIVFQGSEEAFMSERWGSKQPPLACPWVWGFCFPPALLALSSDETRTHWWTSRQMEMQTRGLRSTDPFRSLVLRSADKEEKRNIAPCCTWDMGSNWTPQFSGSSVAFERCLENTWVLSWNKMNDPPPHNLQKNPFL